MGNHPKFFILDMSLSGPSLKWLLLRNTLLRKLEFKDTFLEKERGYFTKIFSNDKDSFRAVLKR